MTPAERNLLLATAKIVFAMNQSYMRGADNKETTLTKMTPVLERAIIRVQKERGK